jgi:hypothetical protein
VAVAQAPTALLMSTCSCWACTASRLRSPCRCACYTRLLQHMNLLLGQVLSKHGNAWRGSAAMLLLLICYLCTLQHAARAQGQWSGMQLAQELAQYQQALPQGGLAAGSGLSAWPPELQPGAQPPAAQQPPPAESHLQRWQRAAQDPLLGHHAELGGQQPLHWSLSGATAAQQQAPPQQPVSLQQGLQGLQQLAAYSGWESQADQQLQSHHQVLLHKLVALLVCFLQSVAACCGTCAWEAPPRSASFAAT